MFFANFIEKGTVNNIEDKLKVWNSKLLLVYAKSIGFDWEKNDSDRAIWKKFVENVSKNEDKFFTKEGDYRKKFLVNLDEIQNLVK